jgi:hypothetical protein
MGTGHLVPGSPGAPAQANQVTQGTGRARAERAKSPIVATLIPL